MNMDASKIISIPLIVMARLLARVLIVDDAANSVHAVQNGHRMGLSFDLTI